MNLDRYTRQLNVSEFGIQEQETLLKKHVVVIGAGGLGSNISDILVRMGLGIIDIVDSDNVELSNIHRTAIFSEEDVGKPKAKILEQKLKKINSEIKISGFQKRINNKNIEQIIKNADIVLDGTDNFETRCLINEACIKLDIPWVYAGVYDTTGMVMGIISQKTPCLRCISNAIPEKSDSVTPVFGNLPVSIASIECTEAIKLLLDKPLSGLIIYDIWKQQFDTIDIKKNPNCNICNCKEFEFL